MKVFAFGLIFVSFVSCRESTTTDIYVFNNTTFHTIDLTIYESLAPKTIKEYTTIHIDKKSSDNSISSIGQGSPTTIFNTYDSVLVTYDDTVHTIHYSKVGQPTDPTSNQILDRSSWIVSPCEETKKSVIINRIYTFTEEDYLNAL